MHFNILILKKFWGNAAPNILISKWFGGKAVQYIWWKDRHHQIVPFIPSYPPHPTLTIWQVENEKTIWTFFWQKVHETLTKCMFWKFDDSFIANLRWKFEHLQVREENTEILQIAMNPARVFVTHIGKTLKNGTGFQATCINMIQIWFWYCTLLFFLLPAVALQLSFRTRYNTNIRTPSHWQDDSGLQKRRNWRSKDLSRDLDRSFDPQLLFFLHLASMNADAENVLRKMKCPLRRQGCLKMTTKNIRN